mgnify:FL=1
MGKVVSWGFKWIQWSFSLGGVGGVRGTRGGGELVSVDCERVQKRVQKRVHKRVTERLQRGCLGMGEGLGVFWEGGCLGFKVMTKGVWECGSVGYTIRLYEYYTIII